MNDVSVEIEKNQVGTIRTLKGHSHLFGVLCYFDWSENISIGNFKIMVQFGYL